MNLALPNVQWNAQIFYIQQAFKPMSSSLCKAKLPTPSLFNPENARPCSLVSYANSINELGEKQLTTLKMTVLSARSPAKSALKDRNPSPKKRKVLFSDFVVEKEKNDIYLTKMSFEAEDSSEWKSKLIVDRTILHKLTFEVEVHTLIEKLRNTELRIAHNKQPASPRKPPPKSSARTKRTPLGQIFESHILQLCGSQQCIYQSIDLPDWNKYLQGIFCMLNAKRDILSQIIKEGENGTYTINLYNHSHVMETFQVNDVFEEQQGVLLRCSQPFVMRNGKMEIWNCLLDRFLRGYSGRSAFKTRQFLQAITGQPIKQQATGQIQMLPQFLSFYTKNFLVMGELKSSCAYIECLKILNIDGQHYQFVVVACFDHQTIACSFKHSPLYEKCSYLQKHWLKDLEEDYRVLVLVEDFKVNFGRILVGCSFGRNRIFKEMRVGKQKVAFIESLHPQNIVFKITPQEQETLVILAELFGDGNDHDTHFKRKVRGQEIIYHRLERGFYEIQTSGLCKLQIYGNYDLKLAQEDVPEGPQSQD